jgi:TRAP-type C4-dicarboxylate transport system permease small subunit
VTSPPAATNEPAWVPTYPLIRRVDEAWYRIERTLCAVLFLAMATLVFAAVVNETFGTRRQWTDVAILFGVVLLGVRTRAVKGDEKRLGWPMSLAWALGITAAIVGVLALYLRAMSGSMIWAQKLTLVMMMWVALLGASMATHERSHLALEMGEKVWPAKWLRFVKAAAHVVTAAFCLGCFVLAVHLVRSQAAEGIKIEDNRWLEVWQAFLIMPYTFAMMTLRFLAQAVTVATATAKPAEDRLPT